MKKKQKKTVHVDTYLTDFLDDAYSDIDLTDELLDLEPLDDLIAEDPVEWPEDAYTQEQDVVQSDRLVIDPSKYAFSKRKQPVSDKVKKVVHNF